MKLKQFLEAVEEITTTPTEKDESRKKDTPDFPDLRRQVGMLNASITKLATQTNKLQSDNNPKNDDDTLKAKVIGVAGSVNMTAVDKIFDLYSPAVLQEVVIQYLAKTRLNVKPSNIKFPGE